MARLHVQVMRDKKKQEKLALVAKQKVEEMKARVAEAKRAEEERKEEAALRIQGFFRGWKARAIAAKKQRDLKFKMEIAQNEAESKKLAEEAEAERKKQAVNLDLAKLRDDMAKKSLERKKEERKQKLEQQRLEQKQRYEAELAAVKRETAAVGIQVWFRDWKDRQLVKKELLEI